MAKVKYSALLESMRNKLNGSVASRNRYGNYWRNKTSPINRQTEWQTAVRAQFANNSSAWRGLTASQRESWNAASANFPFTDVFGDQLTLSGNSLYLKLNQNLQNMGESTISEPPLPVAVPDAGSVTVLATGGTVTVQADGTPGTNGTFMIYVAANVSPGKQYVKNLYKFITVEATLGTAVDITTAVEERFGALSTGTAVWAKVLIGDTTTGQQGQPSSDHTIVAA